jgi:ubiquinone/menaquinone biosynthesis C-methylase UbiE
MLLDNIIIEKRLSEASHKLNHYKIRTENFFNRLDKSKFQKLDQNFLRFVDTEAIIYITELSDCGFNFPKWQDMLTVGGETDLRLFLKIGRQCYDNIYKYLPTFKVFRKLKILDFGVGCARTARHFYRENSLELHGCDVDSSCVKYLLDCCPSIQPLISSNKPPLPYYNNYFDFVYSISVFSHFNSQAFLEWLNELSRIIVKDGLLAISVHGLHAFNIISKWKNTDKIGIDNKLFKISAPKFCRDLDFLWLPQFTTSKDIDTHQYGISFINKIFLNNINLDSLKIIHYGEGEVNNWQDLIVFKKI